MSVDGSVDRAAATGISVSITQDGPILLEAAFACMPGEVLALVGPSGSGKSTLLRAIAGTYRPRAGRVEVGRRLWFDSEAGVCLPAHRRAVGMVFQSYALFPHMTALGNVMAAMDHLPSRQRARRAADLLEMVNLAGLQERRPAALSGGQQQRVAVARALAREPAVLLLDEPFAAVDKATRERLYRELALMRRRLSMPVVLVTHDLDEAIVLADTLCLLHRGRTLQVGSPLDVVRQPVSVEAARLVGHRNLFDGEVAEHRPDAGLTLLRWADQTIEARYSPGFAPGQRVTWLIPPSKVILHRRGRPSRGEMENPVSGIIAEHLAFGDTTVSVLHIDDCPERALTVHVPRHVAERNGLAVGERARVSLLGAAVHMMAPS